MTGRSSTSDSVAVARFKEFTPIPRPWPAEVVPLVVDFEVAVPSSRPQGAAPCATGLKTAR